MGEIEFVEVTAAVEIELIGGACCCCKGKIRPISISLSKYFLESPFTKMGKNFEQQHKFKLGKIEFVGVTAVVEIEFIGGACCCCKGKIRSISILLSNLVNIEKVTKITVQDGVNQTRGGREVVNK